MEINNKFHNRFMDKTIKVLSRALDFHSTNHRVISGNLANIDTPGYKPREVLFDEELKRATENNDIRIRATNPGHITHPANITGKKFPIQIKKAEMDGSRELNLDIEMAKMMRNNLLFETSTRLLTKKFKSLRAAIEGKR